MRLFQYDTRSESRKDLTVLNRGTVTSNTGNVTFVNLVRLETLSRKQEGKERGGRERV